MRRPPPSDGETNRARWSRERTERIAANGPRERYTTRDIGERDGWVCGICRDPIDPVSYRAPDPRSASIDHIRSIVRGGADIRANVRIAHLFCNQDRHDDDGFTDDELAEQRQKVVNFWRARGDDDIADSELAKPLRRLSDPAEARRALAARIARIPDAKPVD